MSELDLLFLYKKLNARKFKGNLDLFNIKVSSWFRIPDNSTIEGYLNLSLTTISKLPKNLQRGSLYLFKCKNLKELPEGLKVKNIIDLRESSIEQLPKNLQCRNLWLDRCKNIKELSNGLWVKDLVITNSGLTEEYCEQQKQEGKISYKNLYN